MPARVYECDESEVKTLKKLLTYDPYLDPNLIPKLPEVSDKDRAAMADEQKKDLKAKEDAASTASKKLREDKYANVIFARLPCFAPYAKIEVCVGRYLKPAQTGREAMPCS